MRTKPKKKKKWNHGPNYGFSSTFFSNFIFLEEIGNNFYFAPSRPGIMIGRLRARTYHIGLCVCVCLERNHHHQHNNSCSRTYIDVWHLISDIHYRIGTAAGVFSIEKMWEKCLKFLRFNVESILGDFGYFLKIIGE